MVGVLGLSVFGEEWLPVSKVARWWSDCLGGHRRLGAQWRDDWIDANEKEYGRCKNWN